MKKHFGLLAMLILATLPCAAQTLKLYDNFSGPFISPSKWSPQWQCGGTVMECVREIREDQLRLRVRAYGATNTNDGTQFGGSGLSLVNNSVTDIAADLTVSRSTAQACRTNPGFGGGGHAHVLLFGSFFNGGAGTSDDDVEAYLQLDRYATDSPGMVDVGGFMFHQGQFFGNVDLGLVNVGERVRVAYLRNHRDSSLVSELRLISVKLAIGSFVPADDLPTGVDTPGTRKLCARETEAGIFRADGEKCMESTIGVQVCTHELAAHIDSVHLRECGSRNRNIEARTPSLRADEAVLQRGNASVPSADQVSAFIDAEDACVHGAGKIPFGKGAVLPDITMASQRVAVCVEDVPLTDDRVRIRYSKSISVASSWKVERGHHIFAEKKSVKESVISHKFSDHIAEIICLESLALICA